MAFQPVTSLNIFHPSNYSTDLSCPMESVHYCFTTQENVEGHRESPNVYVYALLPRQTEVIIDVIIVQNHNEIFIYA